MSEQTTAPTGRDELAKVVYQARWVDGIRDAELVTDAKLADAILAAGYRKPRTVSTVEELDALGFESVILDSHGTPYVCESYRTDGTYSEWRMSGKDFLIDAGDVFEHSPITVVHSTQDAS